MKQLQEAVERDPLFPGNTFEEWFRKWLEENSEGYDEGSSGLAAEIVEHGVNSGYPELTYYSDTTKLYAEHKEGIWEILGQQADDEGTDVLTIISRNFSGGAPYEAGEFENAMVWVAVEILASAIQNEAEEDYSDLDGDLPEEDEDAEKGDEDL